jgi:hypothetical protein
MACLLLCFADQRRSGHGDKALAIVKTNLSGTGGSCWQGLAGSFFLLFLLLLLPA